MLTESGISGSSAIYGDQLPPPTRESRPESAHRGSSFLSTLGRWVVNCNLPDNHKVDRYDLATARTTRKVGILVAVPIIAAASALVGLKVKEAITKPSCPTETRSVRAEGTLWDLAKEINPGGDTQETVHCIRKANDGLNPGTIQIGQQISAPKYVK
jgi:LysM domain